MKGFLNWVKNLFVKDKMVRPYLIPSVTILCCIIASVIGAKMMIKGLDYNKVELDENELGITNELELPEGITSIALFGVDARNENYVGLSDSIMILTVDSIHNDIKLVSIMRDSLVKVEGLGHQKINAAYSYGSARGGAKGGAQMAIKTINQNFNLAIRDYATVDFVGMADLINIVGGVEAEVTDAEVRNANKQIREMHRKRGTPNDLIEHSGKQTLNGIQAVAWARVRKVNTVNGTSGDMGRTERQRHVMYQLFQKAVKMKLSDYPAMIEKMIPCMETSLDESEILDLAALLVNKGLQFKQARVPANEAIIKHGLYVRGLGSCMYYNLDYAADQLHAFMYDDISFEEYMEQNGVDRTPWFTGATYNPNEQNQNGEEAPPEEGELPPENELPDVGTSPDTGLIPDPGTNPDVGTDPEPGTNPDVGTDPEPGTNPDVGTNPEPGTNPDVGTNPDTGTTPGGDTTTGGDGTGGETTPTPDPNPTPTPEPTPTPTPEPTPTPTPNPGAGGVV